MSNQILGDQGPEDATQNQTPQPQAKTIEESATQNAQTTVETPTKTLEEDKKDKTVAENNADASPSSGEQLAFKAAAAFGRIDEEGRVFVKEDQIEREVGQYAGKVPSDPLNLYIRRFLDLKAQVDLAHDRLATLSATDIDYTIKNLKKSLEEPPVVGDIAALRARVVELEKNSVQRKAEIAKEREAAKAKALEYRTKLVTSAEAIAATDPQKMQWKQSGIRIRELFEQWREAQRKGPRLDRTTEDGLWKRFSVARTTYDRNRKAFFSALDAQQAKAKEAKEKLITRAAELSTSTDWQATSAAYRDLLNQWKAAGRASRKEDEELWQRFRAAQEGFFQARDAANAQADAQLVENQAVKEKLAEEAEKLLPITDLNTAKALLRPILEKWDAAGKVPRSEMGRLEGRIRAVEQAISAAENEHWSRNNPETKARAKGMVGQLLDSINALEEELAQAKEAGDTQKAAGLEESISARRTWLEQAKKAAGEN